MKLLSAKLNVVAAVVGVGRRNHLFITELSWEV